MTDYLDVRFTKDCPRFEVMDGKKYGDFEDGDEAEIPKEHAEIIVRRGLGILVSDSSECPVCDKDFSNPLVNNDRIVVDHSCDWSDDIPVSIQNN